MKMSPTTVQIQIEQHQLKKELHSPPSQSMSNISSPNTTNNYSPNLALSTNNNNLQQQQSQQQTIPQTTGTQQQPSATANMSATAQLGTNYPCYGGVSPTEGSTASDTSSNNGSTTISGQAASNRSRAQSGPTAPVAATATIPPNDEDQFSGICPSTSFASPNTSSVMNNTTPLSANSYNQVDMKLNFNLNNPYNNNMLTNQQQQFCMHFNQIPSSSNTSTPRNDETPLQFTNNNIMQHPSMLMMNNNNNPNLTTLTVRNPFEEEDLERPQSTSSRNAFPQIPSKTYFDYMREMRIRHENYATDPNQNNMLRARMPFHFQAILPSGRGGLYPYPVAIDQTPLYQQAEFRMSMARHPHHMMMMMNSAGGPGIPPQMMNGPNGPIFHPNHPMNSMLRNGGGMPSFNGVMPAGGMAKLSPGQYPPPPNMQQMKAAAAAGMLMHPAMMNHIPANNHQIPQSNSLTNNAPPPQKPAAKPKKREKTTKKQQQQQQQQQQAQANIMAAQAQAQAQLNAQAQAQQQRLMMMGGGAGVANPIIGGGGSGISMNENGSFSPAYMHQNELRQRLQPTPNSMPNESPSPQFKVPGRSPPMFQRINNNNSKLFPMPQQRFHQQGDCNFCKQKINAENIGIQCTAIGQGCKMKYHPMCAKLSPESLDEFIKDSRLEWVCHFCRQSRNLVLTI